MPTLTTYVLSAPPHRLPLAPHFGREGIGYEEADERWPSDSLFAALVAQAALLEGVSSSDVPAFARAFHEGEPPLLHSSLFPMVGGLPLLPRPLMMLNIPDVEYRRAIGKGFKKLRYLSPALFRAVCAGEPIDGPIIMMQKGAVWITPAEARSLTGPWARAAGETEEAFHARLTSTCIWKRHPVPHVSVDRSSSASAIFEVGRVVYAEGSGLTLLVQYNDQTWRERFELLLTLLSESGIGGKRGIGYGAFSWTRGPDLSFPDHGSRQVLLSRYLPTPAEIHLLRAPGSAYDLVTVGGWFFSAGSPSGRRSPITLVTEGSVMATNGLPLRGRIADVRPPQDGPLHPVYRAGLALSVPAAAPEAIQ